MNTLDIVCWFQMIDRLGRTAIKDQAPALDLTKDRDIVIVYVHANFLRDRSRRFPAQGWEGMTILSMRCSRRTVLSGKARDLHLTATFAFTCLLFPEGGSRKRKIARRERSASVLGFSLTKKAPWEWCNGKRRRERERHASERARRCLRSLLPLLKTRYVVLRQRKREEIAGGKKKRRSKVYRYMRSFSWTQLPFSKFIGN